MLAIQVFETRQAAFVSHLADHGTLQHLQNSQLERNIQTHLLIGKWRKRYEKALAHSFYF